MSSAPGEQPLVIAFYLPQFHPTPENDAWWQPGFTEWHNVVQAAPLFDGHYQPHLPGELGFYDLRVAEVREQQSELARRHGIDAFCYYHYWFGGRRLLERTFAEVRASGRPDLPFCLCWANENWSPSWDSRGDMVLVAQEYGPEERAAHIVELVASFGDERYLRKDGRPIFMIYRIQEVPDAEGFVADLRAESLRAGTGDPYVVRFDTYSSFDDPAATGCDAAAQFFPHGIIENGAEDHRLDLGDPGNTVLPYDEIADLLLALPPPEWTRHECVTPGWDNTPRRGDGHALVIHGSTPEGYERWLRAVVDRAPARGGLVFVNAWNEWAEGAHLEPDQRWGDAYLRAHAQAVLGREPGPRAAPVPPAQIEPIGLEERYRSLWDSYLDLQRRLSALEGVARRAADRELTALREELAEQKALVKELSDDLVRVVGHRPPMS